MVNTGRRESEARFIRCSLARQELDSTVKTLAVNRRAGETLRFPSKPLRVFA